MTQASTVSMIASAVLLPPHDCRHTLNERRQPRSGPSRRYRRPKSPPDPPPPEPTMELGEAAYACDNGTPGCLARRSLSDAAQSPLLLLPAVSPPVAARDGRAVCSLPLCQNRPRTVLRCHRWIQNCWRCCHPRPRRTVAASPSLLPASADAPLLVDAPPSCLLLLRVASKLMGSSFFNYLVVVLAFSSRSDRCPKMMRGYRLSRSTRLDTDSTIAFCSSST